jgi:hypothetical protein
MKFIVVRAIPFTPTQQRRRQRRPDIPSMIPSMRDNAGQLMNDERLMDDQRLHRPEQAGAGQAAHGHLVQTRLTTDSSPAALTRAATGAWTPKYPDASHARHVEEFTDWVVRRVDELVALNQDPPIVVPVTVTFSPGSTRPDQVLREYERFYARLCRLLVKNHDRPSKRPLLPFALAFRDDPSTRPDKHRDRPTVYDVFFNHPSVAPHVHSLVVVHPTLVDRFLGIADALEATWRRIPARTADPTSPYDAPTYANRTLHADVPFALGIRELMRADHVGSGPLVRARVRRVVDYCAKLGRRRRGLTDDADLFTMLPTASREVR